jgi:hypothetical protein
LALLVVACSAQKDEAIASGDGALTGGSFAETTQTALPAQACGPGLTTGCYTNYGVVADLDGDGNFDIALANGGNHFVPGSPEPQAVYFGDGHGKFGDGASAFVGGIASSLVRQLAVADFDGDGRLDVFYPGGYGLTDDQLFFQGSARYFQKQAGGIGVGRSHAGGVHAGDIDDDGDMDLVVADWGDQPNPNDAHVPASAVNVRIYENDGHGHFTAGAVLPAPGGSSATDVDLQDVNGDFALDIVLTQRNGQSRLYLNDGKGRYTDATESLAFPRKQGPFTFNAELCDLDGDQDLDILFDGGASNLPGHSSQLLINDGTGRFTDETTARIANEPTSDDNQLKCVDYDNDGFFDLVVASLSNPEEKLLRNVDGQGHFKMVEHVFPRLGDPTLSIDFGDFDGDGRPDMMTAQGEVPSQPWLDRTFKNNTASVGHRKPVLRAVQKPVARANAPTVMRLAVSAGHTSETGQHVKSVTLAVSVDGYVQTIPAQFVGGDLFRAVLPAQPAGKVLQVAPHAVDRTGAEVVGETVDVAVR